jgi:hypothetical protein
MSFFTTSILVLARKLLSNLTYLQEAHSHNSISEGKAILEKILESTPYTGIYDEFPKETIELGPDQQEEVYVAEFKIPSNPSYNRLPKNLPFREHITLLVMMNPILLHVPLTSRMTFSLMLILGTP